MPVGSTSEFRALSAEMSLGTSGDAGTQASGDTAADAAAEASGPRQVLLVAHGHFLRVLAARWLGMEPVEGRHFVLETAAVCRLGWDKKTPAIAGWNL
ncbi:histidine phosphatase family protein [Arthrobacter sp. CAU 1506]|nr:histidine phosphatase family protein [Arthrobacter sp. CAU 1506]